MPGSGYQEYRENMGRYGKGIMNSSGKRLLKLCKTNDLIITNTKFKHKKSHITTWIPPFRNFTTKEGEERRNPVRNQIDYIIVRDIHRRFVQNSRSYIFFIYLFFFYS